MEKINITSDVAAVAKKFAGKMNAKNIRFATAVSLTKMIQGAQGNIRKTMPKTNRGPFYVRRNWVLSGIRIKTASVSGLKAEVYSLDSGGRRPFMGIQESGGIKVPSVADHLAVPTAWVQPNINALIRNELKPKALLGQAVPDRSQRPTTYVMRQSGYDRTITKGRGTAKVTRRVKVNFSSRFKTLLVKGKDAGTEFILIKVGGKYRVAWRLVPRAKIKQTRFVAGPASRFVKQNAEGILMRNFADVLRSG
ncbi:MAG: hypothetical protein CGW95_01240 [Phenylobacterium zucineum]|nr:MAG: hypothetical protein CGW95_01240 [Phenylobacterium zucineum]